MVRNCRDGTAKLEPSNRPTQLVVQSPDRMVSSITHTAKGILSTQFRSEIFYTPLCCAANVVLKPAGLL